MLRDRLSNVTTPLRAHRDKVAAHRYFEKAIDQNGEPETVTIDKSGFFLGQTSSRHDEQARRLHCVRAQNTQRTCRRWAPFEW